MALYTSFFRSVGTSFCHKQCVVKILQREAESLNLLHFRKRHFTSSLRKKKPRLEVENLRNSKQDVPEGNLGLGEAVPFSIHLLVKPFLFTAAFSSASIAGTAIWQYENVRKKAMTLMKKSWLSENFNLCASKKYGWRNEVNKFWNRLTEGQKLFVPICFLNVIIFLAWKVPRFQPTMIKYFCSSPFSKATCWPMVLSTFSHYNAFHLIANMYVLHSFSNRGVDILGKEQFLALYLSGGVISSFFSYLYKTVVTKQTLSVGASGAVMAILAYTCAKYPESKLAIIFLPWFVFSAGTGMKCLIGLDVLGVLCRWKFFDHAAHLGGALTGIGWCYWGNAYIWQKREPLLHWWHEIRSASK